MRVFHKGSDISDLVHLLNGQGKVSEGLLRADLVHIFESGAGLETMIFIGVLRGGKPGIQHPDYTAEGEL